MTVHAQAWEQVKQAHLLAKRWPGCWVNCCSAPRDIRDIVQGVWWIP